MRKMIALLALGACLMSAPSARADLDAFLRGCNSPDTDAERAVELCTLALKTGELGPTGEAQTFYTRGNAFLELGNTRLALRDYDSAKKRDDSIFQIWEARGRALFRLGRLPESYQSFARALELNPNDRQARLGRGAAAVALGQPEEAMPDLEAAISEKPDDPTGYFHRALAFIALDNKAQAASSLDEVIALSPRYARAYFLRGQLREEDRPSAALEDYDTAIELEPEDGRIYHARAKLLDAQGRREDANADFRRAYELGIRDEQLNKRLLEIGG